MKCNPFRVLAITDGTTRINLLEKKSGFCCIDWTPAVTEPKGGGVWRDSPLAHGRRLAMQRRANAVETYALQVRNWNPDDLIRDTQDLRRLLEKAVAYDTTEWQDEPVWIEALGVYEENKRYSLIRDYRAAADGYPYGSAFWNALGRAAVSDWPLVLEREPFWRSVPPGQPCPDERYETGCFPSFLEFDGDTSDVDCGNPAKLNDLPDNAVAGKGQITLDGYVRTDGYGEGGLGVIIGKGRCYLRVDNAVGLYGLVDCATQDAISTSGLDEFTADGQQVHVLMCYDETGADTPAARTVYLAVAGIWVASYPTQQVSIGNYVSDSALNLIIGNNLAGAAGFDGGIGWKRVSDNIRYDPAGGDFVPPPRCDLPPTDANTMGLWIYEGGGVVAHDLGISPAADGDISNCEWGCDCEYSDPVECNCVQASGEEDWHYSAEWVINTNLPVNVVNDIIELSSGRLLAFDGGDIMTPAGAALEVWRSDNGVAWFASAAAPGPGVNNLGSSLAAASATNILAAGYDLAAVTPRIWRSVNAGVNWANRSNAAGAAMWNSLVYRPSDGCFYLGDQGFVISRSCDEGLNWTIVSSFDAGAMFVASDDILYAGGLGSSPILDRGIMRSVDGINWARAKGVDVGIWAFAEFGSYIYSGSINGEIYRSLVSDGLTWCLTSHPTTQEIRKLTVVDDLMYAVADTDVWVTDDGLIWKQIADSFAEASSLVERSASNLIYLGEDGDVWTYDRSPTNVLGRQETCLDEIFVANKKNVAQLTHVKVYDASGPTYTDHFPAAVLPFSLLPPIFAVGDAVYFGINPAVIDSGPFDNLVFDIDMALIAAHPSTMTWEYSNNSPCNWVTLNVHDETASLYPFEFSGVGSVHWIPPDDWTPCMIDGVTAYWVRMHISVLAGFIQSPRQGRRDIYTVNWPRIEVDEARVGGDVPALLRIKAHNRSDEDAYENVDELDLLNNRMIVGLRALARGEKFAAFLNCSDVQVPIGIATIAGTGTVFADEFSTPTGRVAVHTTQGNGLTTYDDAFIITLGSSVARHYYGEFHVFLRAQLYEPSASPVGNHDDVRVRLKVQSGTGGVIEYTDFQQFIGFDAWDGVAGIEETYKDWQLLDFGRVTLPVTTLMKSDELPDQFTITVQAASVAATNLRVDLYDLVLIPVDEWPGDFVDTALEDDSGVSNGYLLDVDSVSFPKRDIRALVRTADASAFVKSVYQPVTPGPALLQANADQRLWFLSARGVYLGYQTGGGPGAAFLTDSYADFLDAGVKPGMTIWNLTDGSSGPITAVTQTTVTATLAGGAGNDWDDADEYLIVCPNWRSEPWVVHSVQLWHVARYFSFRGDR